MLFDATVLLDFVWFILCLKFGSRNRESWRKLKQDSFEVLVSGEGKKFIHMVHPETFKIYRNKQHGYRYLGNNMQGLTQNPVEVVEFCLKKSNSDFEVFFQAPRLAFGSEMWFKKEPVGKNPLGNMMQSISRKADS